MELLLNFIYASAIFAAVLAVDCGDINFNSGGLNLNKCSGALGSLHVWSVISFQSEENFQPRNNKTKYFIAKNKANYADVCSETEEYEADEFSYVIVGFYIEKFKPLGTGDLTVELLIGYTIIAAEKVPYTNSATEWREIAIKVPKSGPVRVNT